MNTYKHFVPAFFAAFVSLAIGQHANMKSSPMMQGKKHSMGVDSRGDMAMGFSHEKTQHHFRLFADGGCIDVEAKDIGQQHSIRDHLKMIRGMFASGDFHLPMFIHDRTVPGQRAMEALKSKISYRYSSLPMGARVRMRSRNPKAVAAIHKFLAFQVKDHRTGDSGKVEKP